MKIKFSLPLVFCMTIFAATGMVTMVHAAGTYSGYTEVNTDKVTMLEGKKLKTAKTKAVLDIFEDISQIPRCSLNDEGISAWLVDWARKRKFQVISDEFNNVLITVPASRGFEHREPIVLQAHMDMVCLKTPDSLHDFTQDPIDLVREGDWLSAKDTTLGADDGVGIALALAMADHPPIDHPKLEILITTDEETGMTGAAGLSNSLLTARKYINLDSETEGVMIIGAAGGIQSPLTRPLSFSSLDTAMTVFSLKISGLLGGHSGVDINKGRANANYLVAQALAGVESLRLIDFAGGTAGNAITESSEILFAIDPGKVDELQTRITQFEQDAREQYPTETGMTVTLTELSNTSQLAAAATESADAISLIAALPQGVTEWSTEFEGLPETSNNIGIVETETAALKVSTYARSFDTGKLEDIASLIETTAYDFGGSTVRDNTFPTWPPNTNSAFYETFLESYQDFFGTPMVSEVVHAGLECGYIIEKYPDMEIVSIGPTLEDVHTTRERLYVPSVEKIAQLLAEVMKRP